MSNKKGNIIDDHRQALMMSGNLSDFQIQNLKAWPNIVFDDVKNFKLTYNFVEKIIDEDTGDEKDVLCAGKVIYDIVFNEEPAYTKEEKTKRLDDIKLWVKTMFWKDTKVTIKKNGKKWT